MDSNFCRFVRTTSSRSTFIRARRLGVATAASVILASCVDGEEDRLVDTLDSDTQSPVDTLGEDSGEASAEDAPRAAASVDEPSLVPFEAIVKFRDAAPVSARSALLAGGELAELAEGISLVRFAADRSAGQDEVAATLAHIDRLRASDDVEYAQANWIFKPSLVPNDTRYPLQWHYPQVNLPAAWDLTTGSPTVRIAIIDVGRTGHPDQYNKWMSGIEYDAVREDGSAVSGTQWNHAVAVAAIAGGRTNNQSGSAGVCWECRLLDINASNGVTYPTFDTAAVIRGIDWAVANGARVINMSFELGEPCSTQDNEVPALKAAIQVATSKGVTVVAAAGNASADAVNTSPASCPGVIAVAATDSTKQLAGYSNFGQVTLAAPGGAGSGSGGKIDPHAQGQEIGCGADPASHFGTWTGGVVTNWTTSTGAKHCDRYFSGTSLAAPHVAGVVGLMLSRNPTLTPAQVKAILQSTAKPACGGKCGAGLLDAYAAVRQAAPPLANNAKPKASLDVKCTGLACTFDAGASTDDHAIVAYEWILPGDQLRTGKLVHAFMPGYGTKFVQLRVTDNFGESSLISKHFTLTRPLVSIAAGQYANPARPDNRLDLIEASDGGLAVTWYTFDKSGRSIWYTSGAGLPGSASWTQPLYRSNLKYGISTPTQVGTISLDFSTPKEAWLSWVLDGVPGGERVIYQFGGSGRSGAWFFPTETQSGRGISVQESSGQLAVNLGVYTPAGDPIWARSPGAAPGSNLTLPLSVYKAKGLCPSCGGISPAVFDTTYSGTMTLKIADGASTSGSASVDLVGMLIHKIWKQQGTIELLTKP